MHTRLLPVPLTGDVYFVSYGAVKFPDAVIDLYGDGVRVELTEETFISKAGITSSTFRADPRRPRELVRAVSPRGQVLRACRERQPL